MVAPVMEQLAQDYQGKVKVAGMNVDHSPDTAAQLGIMAIPAAVFFKEGREVARVVGAAPKAKFVDEIKKSFGI